MNKIKFDSNGIYASDAKLNAIALQVLEQERIERATCRRAAEYETVTFGDMVRGVTDEGDFDDNSVPRITTAAATNVTVGELSLATGGSDPDPL